MFVLISILILVVAALLGLVVLIQNSKGGGLTANLQSQSQIMGVRKTADFLEKATWTLAITMLALCLAATAFIPGKRAGVNTNTELTPGNMQQTMPLPPTAPTEVPN